MVKNRAIAICWTALLLLQFGCKDNPIAPPPLKDPRTLVFTVDTLAYPNAGQTNMYDIAGTAANNVFAVGFNSTSSAGTMYRYDGKSWKTTGFHMSEGGPIVGAIDFSSLLAFSSTNIWFVGERSRLNPTPPPNFIDSSLILQYDGQSWQEYKAYGGRFLESIHGIAPNDIWACGWYGTLLHYNGVTWQRDSIPLSVREGAFFALRAIFALSTQTVYALGQVSKLGEITMFYFFRYSGGSWSVLDGTLDGSDGFGRNDLWASPSGTLYSVGHGVFRWDGTRWIKMLDYPNSLFRIWGYSDDSFFVVGAGGTVLHYNGRDFFQYRDLINDNVLNFGVWGDGQKLFVLGNDGQKSYVFHGR